VHGIEMPFTLKEAFKTSKSATYTKIFQKYFFGRVLGIRIGSHSFIAVAPIVVFSFGFLIRS